MPVVPLQNKLLFSQEVAKREPFPNKRKPWPRGSLKMAATSLHALPAHMGQAQLSIMMRRTVFIASNFNLYFEFLSHLLTWREGEAILQPASRGGAIVPASLVGSFLVFSCPWTGFHPPAVCCGVNACEVCVCVCVWS